VRAATFWELAVIFLISVGSASAVDPYAGMDPYWILLHEPAVVAELKLTASQQPKYQGLLDDLDLRFFPLRNKSQKEALAGQGEIVADVREQLKTLLQPVQNKRLSEILLRRLGPPALLNDDVASRLKYSEAQREQLKKIQDETKTAVTALEKELADGKPRESLEKKFQELKTDEYKQLFDVLKPAQQAAWKASLGSNFDLSKLGQPAFKAPELIDTGEWINSPGLNLKSQRGKVVIVHFYASNCINCIRNYPWYNEWHDKFQNQPVVLVGIHTPETAGEREIASVRKKAAEAKFAFPVLIDGKNENWNAWGNSMWPSVYVLDQRGYLRYFWPGELKWQGNDGEKIMRQRIEQLLAKAKP
jgi:thiol-disulfide isomerase/thioredoxin